jgi:type 1 glutamine amidotransferase
MQRFILGLGTLLVIAAVAAGQKPGMIEKVTKALPEQAPAKPKAKRKLLIYSRTNGFRHSSIAIGTKALAMMGDKTGAYTAVITEDDSYFEPEKLKAFDAVFMLNTTGNCLGKKGDNSKAGKEREEMLKKSLADFVAGGKGLAGCHSATDTYHRWKDYNQMMGGAFVSHPWHKKVPVKNLEPKNPLNAAFDGKDFEIADEIYMFRNDTALPSDRKMLLALDLAKMDPKDVAQGKRPDNLYPVSWVGTFGKGRTFYCSLGHREEIYWNPTILKHYLAGIQYVLGDLEADATPTSK